VAHRWAELLPIAPEAKQRLLAVDSPLLRLELVGDILEQLGLAQ
jgi:Lon protease-like protein